MDGRWFAYILGQEAKSGHQLLAIIVGLVVLGIYLIWKYFKGDD